MTRKREQTFPSTGSDGPTSAQDMPTGPSPSSPPPTDSSPIPSFHPHAPAQAAQPKCKIIAVGGSSGGVGKSIFVANLGVYLSSIGRQTVVVDADASHGSLTALVGGPARPQIGWHATAVPNLSLLITGLDSKWHPSTPKVDISSLYLDLRNKGISHAIIDLGNVDGLDALDAFLDADGMIFITVPEPPALAHTYAFLSRAFLRHMLRKLEGEEHRLLIELANQFTTPPPPLDLWRILDEEGHPLADRIRDEMEHFRPMLVLNQTRLRADLEAGDALRTVIRRRLGLLIEYLGHIEHDDTVWSTVRARKLLLIESPGTKASKNIERIARRLLGIESGKISPFQRLSLIHI
ncbi:MAG: hypothetical protein N2515_08885, partial [Deltaproteobacteria bacterium]|nr:hypothetical protein [Deltaproteobacteria bacterium]